LGTVSFVVLEERMSSALPKLDPELAERLSDALTRAVMYAQTTEPGTFDVELEALCNLLESSACDMAGVTLAEYGRALEASG
jgi:hypothetical protein